MLSLIVPVRNWPGDRVNACVRSFLRLKSKALTELVVVDFGSGEPVALRIADKRLRIVRVEADRWSCAEAINVGVIESRNPVVAKADADIVIARESGPGLDAAVAALRRSEMGLAVVQAIDLAEGTNAKTALLATSDSLAAGGRLRARWGQGGLCMFTAAVWNEIGGFESRYQGWGNEDNDFADRIRRSGHRMRWLKSDAVRIFHVWHPPTHGATDIIKARTINQKLYAEDKSTYRPIRFIHSKPRLTAPKIMHTPRPLVTIAFASKARASRERMLLEAIRGFRGQIDEDFEIVVADNGSTPEESARLRKSLASLPGSMRVRVIDIAEPSIPRARNRITDEALGRYICVADDDDIPLPNRLADHLACFDSDPNLHGSHGGWIDFDELTGVVDYNTGGERRLETLLFGRGKVTAHPSSFYRRDAMQAVRYDESFKVGSDLDMAVRMANMGFAIGHAGSYVTLRRFHDRNVTITDLFGQTTVGVDARQRVSETLGAGLEWRLRELGKAAPANVQCRNQIGKETVLGLIPRYCGVWRLSVPLSDLGRTEAAGDGYAPIEIDLKASRAEPGNRSPMILTNRTAEIGPNDDGAMTARALTNGAPTDGPDLVDLAAELAAMIEGDVGIIDNDIDPRLCFISRTLKGGAKALKLKSAIEDRFGLTVDLFPEVEYQQRRTTRFDWSRLAGEPHGDRLLSMPIKGLERVLTAIEKMQPNTALRAMTSILSDFNCTEQLYYLVTTPIRTAEGPRAVKKIIEKQTGETFRIVKEGDIRPKFGRVR